MNDQQVKQQIQQMVSFIRQEADEKANEIKVKAEEEFNIRKLSAVEAARAKIRADYDKKSKQIVVNQKIAKSTQSNGARLRVLKAMDLELQNVLVDAKKQLASIRTVPSQYKALMESLILQGCLALRDSVIVLKVRLDDAPIVKELIGTVSDKYKKMTKSEVKLSIDGSVFLDESCAGGVVLYSQEGRIFLDNSFEARLAIAYEQNMPVIRTMLFQNVV